MNEQLKVQVTIDLKTLIWLTSMIVDEQDCGDYHTDIETFFTAMLKQNKRVVKQIIQKLQVLNENTDYSHIDDKWLDSLS